MPTTVYDCYADGSVREVIPKCVMCRRRRPLEGGIYCDGCQSSLKATAPPQDGNTSAAAQAPQEQAP